MARLTIDLGTAGNSATGDSVRGAFNKVNRNFEELYGYNAADGLLTTPVTNGDVRIQPNGTGVVEIDNLQVNGSTITPITTNGDLTLNANGTGNVLLGNFTFNADQSVGAGQDNYVMTYDHNTGTIGLEAASGGSSTLTFVGDDSTGTTVNTGETFKIAGTGTVTTSVSGDTLTITGSSGAQYVEQSCRSSNPGDVVVATAISGSPDQIYMAVSTSSDASSSRECILRLPAGTVNGQTLAVRHQATSDGSADHTLKILNNDGSDNVQNFSSWSAGNNFKAIILVWNGTRWYTISIL